MQRGRITLDPQLLQERLELAPKSPPPSVRAAPILLPAEAMKNVFLDEFAKFFRSVAFMLEEAN